MRADRAHLHPDRVGERLGELGLPRAREPDRLREDGRPARHQARADLLVDDRGDAEPRLLDEVALDRVRESGGLVAAVAARPADAGDLAEAVPGKQLGVLLRERPCFGELEAPGAAELPELLLEGHLADQVVDALGHRPVGIAIDRGFARRGAQRVSATGLHD